MKKKYPGLWKIKDMAALFYYLQDISFLTQDLCNTYIVEVATLGKSAPLPVYTPFQ